MRVVTVLLSLLLLCGGVLIPAVAVAGQNVLTWTDNSTSEANFDIQRTTAANVAACATAIGFVGLASVGANITTFTDSVVVEGTTYCYRVDASKPGEVSPFSNIAGRTVPLPAPSNLAVN